MTTTDETNLHTRAHCPDEQEGSTPLNETLEFFDWQAQMYDRYQASCVPKYHEMTETAARYLSHVLADVKEPRILDIGCGTGNTTLELSKTFGRAHFTCLDGSKEMQEYARKKLSSLTVGFHTGDLSRDGWHEPWPDHSFDAAVSSLVLEHLPFDAYERFLQSVCRILKPGAPLVTVEGYAGETLQALFFEEMAGWEAEAIRNGHITEEELELVKQYSREKEKHYFASMDERKQKWQEAGLRDVEFIWQYYCVAILCARNAP